MSEELIDVINNSILVNDKNITNVKARWIEFKLEPNNDDELNGIIFSDDNYLGFAGIKYDSERMSWMFNPIGLRTMDNRDIDVAEFEECISALNQVTKVMRFLNREWRKKTHDVRKI